jgi:hypothetical protein
MELLLELPGIIWNYTGIIWNYFGIIGIIWNYMELFVNYLELLLELLELFGITFGITLINLTVIPNGITFGTIGIIWKIIPFLELHDFFFWCLAQTRITSRFS